VSHNATAIVAFSVTMTFSHYFELIAFCLSADIYLRFSVSLQQSSRLNVITSKSSSVGINRPSMSVLSVAGCRER